MDKKLADKIFDVLVKEAGASERTREGFHSFTEGDDPREFRFHGKLGFGGKIWINSREGSICPWYVNCYLEDLTPDRKALMDETNKQLAELWRASKK